jgi:hypothetical protein
VDTSEQAVVKRVSARPRLLEAGVFTNGRDFMDGKAHGSLNHRQAPTQRYGFLGGRKDGERIRGNMPELKRSLQLRTQGGKGNAEFLCQVLVREV